MPDDDAPIHPGGMKPKRVFICPEDVRQPYLIRGHRYLFKQAEGFRVQQLWSEVIAYELARATGTDVPPAFVAVDERRGTVGVLIEFFFGRPDRGPLDRFISAIELMHRAGMTVNERHGCLRDNLRLSRQIGAPAWRQWWAEAIAFDSIIGNNDRHTENWGFLRQTWKEAVAEYRLAPVFDNGTSLGFQVRESELARFSRPAAVGQFVARGAHHYGWLKGEPPKPPHATLCETMSKAMPLTRPTFERIAQLRDSQIEETLHWCTKFKLEVEFTADRAEFVRQLILKRRAGLIAAIGG